jgi:arylsulfatase A-like enzyme
MNLSQLFALCFALVCSAYAQRQDKPNVILFLVDDLGYTDLGVTGSSFYETPRLDALARKGVFFDNAYAANPVCSPTRASILTGKYPSRIGLTNHSGSAGAKGPQYRMEPPAVKGNMPSEDLTLAEAFKKHGYATAHVGKWHLQAHHQKGNQHYPENHGFDLNVAGHKMGQPGSFLYPYQSKQHPSTNVPGLEDGKPGDYLTDVLTDHAIRFIEDKQDSSFFLNFWFYTVHTPLGAKPELLKKYQEKAKKMGLDKKNVRGVSVHDSFADSRQDNPTYAAMVESLDENVGRVLDTLERLNLRDNTILLFFSDNGGLSTGSNPSSVTSILPNKAGKAWVYEGGIRVPLIIDAPSLQQKGTTLTEPVVSTDFYPTLLDLAGLPLEPKQHLDGISLKPLLDGQKKTLEREALFFHYPHYHHINSMGPSGAVRMGDYKLVIRYEDSSTELYNLAKDRGELTNLASQSSGMVNRMKKKFDQWISQTGSLMPTANLKYKGAKKTSSFYTPARDAKGIYAESKPSDNDLPKVFLIGDSISIGYTPEVIQHLQGKAFVSRAKANCGDTNRGLASLDGWLGKTNWDLIHFNWGLHDLCYRNPEVKTVGNRDKVNGTQSVPLAQYRKNLEQLVLRLKNTGAKLIWASTTKVPQGEVGRFAGDELKYNKAALEIMQKYGVAINDLHQLSSSLDPSLFRKRGDVHYTSQGSALLGKKVADQISKALGIQK